VGTNLTNRLVLQQVDEESYGDNVMYQRPTEIFARVQYKY